MTRVHGFVRACLCLFLGSKVHFQNEVPRLLAIVLRKGERRCEIRCCKRAYAMLLVLIIRPPKQLLLPPRGQP